MRCPSCGAETKAANRFCIKCGAPLSPTCAACGALNEPSAKFCGQCGMGLAWMVRVSALAKEKPPGTEPAPQVAERRHLTVMFCDMAGSTALSARLDPEDLSEVIRGFQDACVQAIRRFDGFIARFMGDGVLAYFGYPRAHEDDAERAVRAGLAVVDVISRLMLPTKVRLEVRVGIGTGLVVVGETVGEGSSQEQVVIGEAPNLAARLQAIAEPNSVVIADGTRQLLGRLFDLEDLGLRFLKGMANPIPSWRVVGERAVESRFEAGQTQRATGFFGREREVDLLMDRWVQAQNGEGQVILLSGEAGIGKSRIVAELRQKIDDDEHTRILYQCSPHHTNSPFYPVISQLERAAGIVPSDLAEAKLDKLERVLRLSFPTIDHVAPLFAALLSLPLDGRYAPLNLTPREQKEHTFLALNELLGGLAKHRPVFILEDAHWIDPTTLDLFVRTIDRLQRLPVLLIVTFRSEFEVPWGRYPNVTALVLNRLERGHVAAMIARLTDGKLLPDDVREEITAKTDGVPLFVEELTKAILGSGLLKEAAGQYILPGPLAPLEIPATLHDSLLARLDRLAPVREIAQIGAVIGREFSYQLLDAVAPVHDKVLADALNQLSKAELIFPKGGLAETTYIFKHALVQDAAYRSLLRSTRRQLHGRIAQAISELMPQIVETQPELLAHHYAQAGLIDDAIAYGLRAGRRSAARSANEEAITHYTKALELLGTKSAGGVERDRQELELLIALGVPTIAARGYMAADVERIYGRARDLCASLTDTPHRFTVLRGLWNSAFLRKPLPEAQELSAELLALADAQGNHTRRALAHRAQGCARFFSGEFASGWESFRQAIELWDVNNARAEILVYGEDPSVLCRAYGSWLTWFLGYPDKSSVLISKALVDAKRLSNPFIYAMTLGLASALHIYRNEFPEALERADASSTICAAYGFPQWTAYAMIMRGRAHAALGRADDGIAEMEQGWADWRALGAELATTQMSVSLADACAKAGRIAAGLDHIKVAAEHARTFHEALLEAEIHRVRGELLLKRAATMDAEACLLRSIAIARSQQAKSLELRTGIGLARIWQSQNRRDAAYGVLAPIYGWFSEGFDCPDLRDARALLDDLGNPDSLSCVRSISESGRR